jgi:hypothetical protein
MEIASLILMLLGGVGMTTIIVEGEIFVPIKNFLAKFMPKFFMKMMGCHQCCGFWSGLLISLFFIFPFQVDCQWGQIVLNCGKNFANGCAVSLLSVLWASFMLYIESQTIIRPNG